MSATGLEEISVAAEIFSPAKIYNFSRKLYIILSKNCILHIGVEISSHFYLITPFIFNRSKT